MIKPVGSMPVSDIANIILKATNAKRFGKYGAPNQQEALQVSLNYLENRCANSLLSKGMAPDVAQDKANTMVFGTIHSLANDAFGNLYNIKECALAAGRYIAKLLDH